MKKIILLSVAVAAFSLSSCRKDRTCTCTTTDISSGTTDVSSTVQLVGHATSREAKKESNCYSTQSTITESGNTTSETRDCTLK